jgi:hypothetical protein
VAVEAVPGEADRSTGRYGAFAPSSCFLQYRICSSHAGREASALPGLRREKSVVSWTTMATGTFPALSLRG